MTTTWAGIAIVIVLNIIGWLIAYNRYTRNEAAHMGKLEGKVDSLGSRLDSIDRRIEGLEHRLDSMFPQLPKL